MNDDQRVYFQPGPADKLQYPCIVYERDDASSKYANNGLYTHQQRYKVTLMDEDPDSSFYESLKNLPLSSFDRHFKTSGLNHDVFSIYF